MATGHPIGDPRRHYFLTLAMADAIGVDLADALREGLITRQEYADTVDRCRACDDPAACARWIDRQRRAGETDLPPPSFCGNGALLAELGRI